MKQLIRLSFLFLATIAITNGAEAKIWRLNNNGNSPNPAIQADFTGTLQAAHDNAGVASGDTIHVEQSPVTYGPCTFTKRLIVIGPGYFLNENPQTQVNISYPATVAALVMSNISSAGTQIWGLTITGTVSLATNNLLVGRCYVQNHIYLGSGAATNISGIVIRQNYITPSSNHTGAIQQQSAGAGLTSNIEIVNNSIILATGAFTYPAILDGRYSGIFKNNITYSYYGLSIANFYVVNNMSYSNGGGSTFNNSVLEYNMGSLAGHYVSPGGANNTIGLGNQTRSLTDMKFLTSGSTDGVWQLQASSPAKTAGKDGVDLGSFGGDYPYKLSGIAPIPNIYSLTIAPISAGAANINVTVSAKGNN